jgi:hypothetical protein
MGASGLPFCQGQIALRTNPLAALLASTDVAGELGGTGWTLEQDQPRRTGKDSGRNPLLQFYGLTTFGAGIGGVKDPCLAARTTPHKEHTTFGAHTRAHGYWKLATGAGKGQFEPACWTGIALFVVPALVIQRLPTARTEDLATSRADPIVKEYTRAAFGAAQRVGVICDGVTR